MYNQIAQHNIISKCDLALWHQNTLKFTFECRITGSSDLLFCAALTSIAF